MLGEITGKSTERSLVDKGEDGCFPLPNPPGGDTQVQNEAVRLTNNDIQDCVQ